VLNPNAHGRQHTEESLPLRLSDTQLDEIMRLCQPLALHCRDALLRILAHELRGRRDVGDGELHRIAGDAASVAKGIGAGPCLGNRSTAVGIAAAGNVASVA
jgi:hypothetical protein